MKTSNSGKKIIQPTSSLDPSIYMGIAGAGTCACPKEEQCNSGEEWGALTRFHNKEIQAGREIQGGEPTKANSRTQTMFKNRGCADNNFLSGTGQIFCSQQDRNGEVRTKIKIILVGKGWCDNEDGKS